MNTNWAVLLQPECYPQQGDVTISGNKSDKRIHIYLSRSGDILNNLNIFDNEAEGIRIVTNESLIEDAVITGNIINYLNHQYANILDLYTENNIMR